LNNTDSRTAAPAVAGVIATYMSRAKVPWSDNDKGYARVSAIRDYLRSDASSDIRNPFANEAIRIVWNGATIDDHKGAQALNGTTVLYKPGTCKINLINYRELFTGKITVLAWEGKILDGNGTPIEGCAAAKKTAGLLNDFTLPCPPLGYGLSAHTMPDGTFLFRLGGKSMPGDTMPCQMTPWDLNEKPVPVS
jgi:hypothetical protein